MYYSVYRKHSFSIKNLQDTRSDGQNTPAVGARRALDTCGTHRNQSSGLMVQDLLTIVLCVRARLSGLCTYRQAFSQALKDPA